MCGVSVASIKAANCPKSAKHRSPSSAAYCPVEAKPIAMEHCTGRDYTSKHGGKYNAFCTNYLANADFERPPGAAPARPAAPPRHPTVPAPDAEPPQSTGDQVKQGVSKGLDKLKGLFGR